MVRAAAEAAAAARIIARRSVVVTGGEECQAVHTSVVARILVIYINSYR